MLAIKAVRFKRSKECPWEYGLYIEGKHDIIIDMLGKPVPHEPNIWNWEETHELYFTYGKETE